MGERKKSARPARTSVTASVAPRKGMCWASNPALIRRRSAAKCEADPIPVEEKFSVPGLALAGAAIGFVTGVVLSTGPLSVPAFIAFGLNKGAFLSTEAASSLALMITKVATFREFGALPLPAVVQGLVIGASVMVGSFAGKAVVQRVSLPTFHHVLDALLLVSGLSLLWAAARA